MSSLCTTRGPARLVGCDTQTHMVAWQTLKNENNERRQKLSYSTSGFCMLRVQRVLRGGLLRRLRSQMNKLNRWNM